MAGQNRSLEIVVLANVRVAGTKDDRYPGVPFGGTYYPAGVDKNGKEVPARWEGGVYINRGSYSDAQGNRVERQPDIARLVLWNGRNIREQGKGLADIAAKCLSPGKELSCLGNLHSYMGRVFIDGQPRQKADGSIALTQKHSITVIPGTMNLGADADKLLAFEYQNFQRNPQQFSFWSRPLNWQTGQQDHQTWLAMSNARMSTTFQGGDIFGYAIVGNTRQANAPQQADNNPLANAFGMAMGAGMTGGQQFNTGAPTINNTGVYNAGQMPNIPNQGYNTGAPAGNAGYGAQNTGYGAPSGMPAQNFQQNAGVPAQGGQPF